MTKEIKNLLRKKELLRTMKSHPFHSVMTACYLINFIFIYFTDALTIKFNLDSASRKKISLIINRKHV